MDPHKPPGLTGAVGGGALGCPGWYNGPASTRPPPPEPSHHASPPRPCPVRTPHAPVTADHASRRARWLPARRSLGFKFVIAVVTLVAIVLAANASVMLITTRNRLKNDIEREALGYAQLAAAPLTEAYRTYYMSGYGKFRVLATGVLALNPNIERVAIYDTEGHLLFESTEFENAVFDPAERARTNTQDTRILAAVKNLDVAKWRDRGPAGEPLFTVVAPDVEDWGRHRYSVAFTSSYHTLRQAMFSASWQIAGLTAGAIVLGILIALLLARQSMRPVSALTQTARGLAAGDLEKRITLKTGDEFELLGEAFNQMAARLAATIADLERTNRALNQTNLELRDLDRMKSDLLANVSHELRTPLTAIRGYTEALDDGLLGPVDASQRQALAAIDRNIDRLISMIEQLLSYSRAERGAQELDLHPFDLAALVEQVAETVRTASAASPRITVEPEEGLPRVFADASRIAQVIENLLNNAVKFTPLDGNIRVRLRQRIPEHAVEVEVGDTGIGIPEEQRERIFDRFYQVDSTSARRYGGIGLGLALVREILDAHHRRIEVEGAPGRGTTFRFSLPVADAASANAPPRGRLVLLVDDDPAFCQGVSALLGAEGYEVETALSGDRALRMLDRAAPDCIILDRLLPDTDGFELLARIRREPATTAVPVIVASVRRERELGLQLGASAYLTKPVDLRELATEVARVLDQGIGSAEGLDGRRRPFVGEPV